MSAMIVITAAAALIAVCVGEGARMSYDKQRGKTSGQTAETGKEVYYAENSYGKKDNKYCFKYKKVDGSWRAYILRTPSFGDKDAGTWITHRVYDGDNSYISWNEEVMSLSDMKKISHLWANLIQRYIATGKKFDS